MGVPEGSNPKVEKPRAQDVSSIQLILCVSPPTGLACLLQAYWADRVSNIFVVFTKILLISKM